MICEYALCSVVECFTVFELVIHQPNAAKPMFFVLSADRMHNTIRLYFWTGSLSEVKLTFEVSASNLLLYKTSVSVLLKANGRLTEQEDDESYAPRSSVVRGKTMIFTAWA